MHRNTITVGARSGGSAPRRPRRFARTIIPLCLATVLVAGACSLRPIPPILDSGGPSAERTADAPPPCAWGAVRSCALPYPSDDFEIADATSPTGVRVRMPSEVIPETTQNDLGPGAGLSDAFDGSDGFSALSPIVFEVDNPINGDFFPADGGNLIQVFDLTTGERQPIRAELSTEALRRGAPNTIVMAWPLTRWEYGHRIVASLGSVRGYFMDPSPAKGLLDGHLDPVLADLAAMGVGDGSGKGLLSATRFTVGTREHAKADMTEMANIARDTPHPVRNIEVHAPIFFQRASAFIRGEVAITDFRDSDGIAKPEHKPVQTWIPFIAVLPDKPASSAGAPVAVYGHGLIVSKETMLLVADANSAAGVATIGIDVPNHGERQAGQGGYLLDLANPKGLGRLLSMFVQGTVDHVSLVEAIEEELSGMDVAPWNLDGNHGDGVADLDTSTILYEGTSMGGVLGASEVALTPEIDAAFLQVPGSGVADILYHSQLWVAFAEVIPWSAGAGDAAALMGIATSLVDRGENAHLMDDLRESGRAVFLQVGVGDRIVPNSASDRLAALLGLDQMEPRLGATNRPSSGSTELPADGRGMKEIWPTHSAPSNQGFVAHVSFIEPQALKLLEDWLDDRLLALGVTS